MAIPIQFQDSNGNEKRGIYDHLTSLGYEYFWVDGGLQINSSNLTELLNAANSYDPLPYVKNLMIEKIKQESRVRANALYSFIDPEVGEAESFYQFAEDIYLSISPGSREPLSGSLLAFKNIKDARVAAIATINGYTTEAQVDAYDPVNDPAWGG